MEPLLSVSAFLLWKEQMRIDRSTKSPGYIWSWLLYVSLSSSTSGWPAERGPGVSSHPVAALKTAWAACMSYGCSTPSLDHGKPLGTVGLPELAQLHCGQRAVVGFVLSQARQRQRQAI